ncbi:ROK family transcriptional regulator [Arthrobacter sp. Rue61a]|uniref:ROK family transcriptional regulator n=1 Tax=Arthrobacter sp. Rue61a TaxID=1118963 RepID=UPI00027DF3D7|nr:ROK family transcriptional regulator [Arthrobacter sp. Rue61a]AFR31327.1 ROK family protein [Arthrobacter sp. Rue61a]
MPELTEAGPTERQLVEILLAEGPSTRLALQRRLGISRPTLSSAVMRLIERGLLEENGMAAYGQGRNGRPQALLAPRRSAGAALGIELGRARVAVTVVAVDGTVHAQKLTAVDDTLSLQRRLGVALQSVRTLIASDTLSPASVLGIGVGVAGRHLPFTAEGEARGSEPEGLKFDKLRALFSAPLLWDNNTRLAALRHLGELSARLPSTGFLYVVLSTGISAGIVDGVSTFRGSHGTAGELGHMCVDPAGPLCWCGSRGCLEACIGVGAVVERAQAAGLHVGDIVGLAALANKGDAGALRLVAEVGRTLGTALSGVSMLIDPRRIVLSGRLAGLGGPMLAAAEAEVQARRHAVGLPCPELVLHEGSEFDSSHGAAVSALHRWGADFMFHDS